MSHYWSTISRSKENPILRRRRSSNMDSSTTAAIATTTADDDDWQEVYDDEEEEEEEEAPDAAVVSQQDGLFRKLPMLPMPSQKKKKKKKKKNKGRHPHERYFWHRIILDSCLNCWRRCIVRNKKRRNRNDDGTSASSASSSWRQSLCTVLVFGMLTYTLINFICFSRLRSAKKYHDASATATDRHHWSVVFCNCLAAEQGNKTGSLLLGFALPFLLVAVTVVAILPRTHSTYHHHHHHNDDDDDDDDIMSHEGLLLSSTNRENSKQEVAEEQNDCFHDEDDTTSSFANTNNATNPLASLGSAKENPAFNDDDIISSSNSLHPPARKRGFSLFSKSDDPNVTMFTIVALAGPCLWACFDPLMAMTMRTTTTTGQPTSKSSTRELIMAQANPAGYAACMCLALFLVPVAKHSPFNKALQVSFSQALTFHRVAGWMAISFASVHGILYIIKYPKDLVPWDATCWTWTLFSYEYYKHADDDCYKMWRNAWGVLCLTSFYVLAATSLPWVRRRAYGLFYAVHVPAAWLVMLAGIIHHPILVLFLVPNMIYFLAATVPVWMQQYLTARRQRRRQQQQQQQQQPVVQVTRIPESGNCVALRLACPQSGLGDLHGCGGATVKLCAPAISAAYHPFSVIFVTPRMTSCVSHFGDVDRGRNDVNDESTTRSNEIEILYRASGPWTKSLTEAFFRNVGDREGGDGDGGTRSAINNMPQLLVDGLYPAEYRWMPHRLLHHHDSILLVAGGVGIVPFVNLLHELHRSLLAQPTNDDNHDDNHTLRTRRVELHWYCREFGLCDYVMTRYLTPLFVAHSQGASSIENGGDTIDDPSTEPQIKCEMNLYIHLTSRDADDHPMGEAHIIAPSRPTLRCNDTTTNGGEYDAFEEAYFALHGGSISRVGSVLVFGSIVLLGLVIHVQQYLMYFGNHIVFPKVYGLLWIMTGATIISWLAVSSKNRQSTTAWLCRQKDGNDDDGNENLTSLTSTIRESTTTTFAGETHEHSAASEVPPPQFPFTSTVRRDGVRLSCEILNGRPFVSNVIDCVVHAERPGACFCGPTFLRSSIKTAIHTERRFVRGRFGTPCSIYDDMSEL